MPEEWLESDDEESTDLKLPPEGQTGEAGGQVAGGLSAGAWGSRWPDSRACRSPADMCCMWRPGDRRWVG